MFSKRLSGTLKPNRLTQALRAARAEGRSLIDLTESNPTRAWFEYPADLLKSLSAAQGLRYDPQPFGLLDARRAVAADYRRRGLWVDPERILLTASTSEAYSVLFKLLANPGDEVLTPRPSYPLFEHLTALDGVVSRPYDLEYHGNWSLDFGSIERALTPRTRAVLMVSPNNPTGTFVSAEEIARLAAICALRGAALIADEVFADYKLGLTRTPGAALTRNDVLAFGLGGLSKSVGLPQLKLGWVAVAGPDREVSLALERLEVICDSYLSVSTPLQLSLADLLDRGATVRSQIAARIGANYRKLKELVGSVSSCRVLPAEGGWYAVVQVPTLVPEEELALRLLTEDGVLTHPGYFYDFPRESFLIVSLLVPEPTFSAGTERLLQRAHRPVPKKR